MASSPGAAGDSGPGADRSGEPLLCVVLVEPEIPNNTGNIGRTCVAVGAALHLVHPLGFDLSEKARRRAGLDYWERLRVVEHGSLDGYLRASEPGRRWLLSTRSPRTVYDARFTRGDHLIFGRETAGLPGGLLAAHPGRSLALPMSPGERSLNLAAAVCAVVYEGVRQLLASGQAALDASGRLGPGRAGPGGRGH